MEMQWYVVHTYSGYEEKVKISINDNVRRRGLEEKFDQILIPAEKVIEKKGNVKKESLKKFYPGYILIKMELNDETWHIVSSTPRVTGFVGGEKPSPIQQDEIDMIVQQIEEGPISQATAQYDRGDSVRILDGAFANFNGFVDDIDEVHNKLRVMVTI